MSDRLNHELLSAYLDNEVTEEERAQVEQALIDSAETRTALESLKQVQARLQSVPRLALPDDFHERVVRAAEQRAAARSVTRPEVAAKLVRFAAIGATVAAVLVVAVLIAIKQHDREIGPGETEVVHQDPLPGPDEIAQGPQRPAPKMILVIDSAFTKQAQEADVFGKTLKNAGIAFDPRKEGVVLDNKLRKNLLATRFATGMAAKVNDRLDIIDMVYVQGTGGQIDEIEKKLRDHEQVHVVLDVAFMPESTRVFNSIGQRSWTLAKSDSEDVPRSYAYRVNVGIRLHSSRSGFFAKFPTPGLDLRVSEKDSPTGFNFQLPLDFGADQPKQGDANGNPANNVVEDPIYEVLIIRRNLVAGFPKNAQKPDPK